MNKEILEFINESILLRKEFLDEHTGILGEIKYPSVIRCKKELSIFEQIKKELLEKETVLDDVERDYLKSVLKPFKKKAYYVVKLPSKMGLQEEYICAYVGKDAFVFPNFKKGTMYKEMVNGKEYTLEELGITYE